MGAFGRIGQMIKERRVGFSMDEVMRGHHEFLPGFGPSGRLPMEIRVAWGPRSVGSFLNPLGDAFLTNDLEGTVSVDFLCRETPCRGKLELKYLSEQSIRYTFDFEVRQKPYQYVGEKVNIWPWNVAVSHTTCFGTLTEVDSGKLVSRSVLFFRLSTLPSFLASLRLN